MPLPCLNGIGDRMIITQPVCSPSWSKPCLCWQVQSSHAKCRSSGSFQSAYPCALMLAGLFSDAHTYSKRDVVAHSKTQQHINAATSSLGSDGNDTGTAVRQKLFDTAPSPSESPVNDSSTDLGSSLQPVADEVKKQIKDTQLARKKVGRTYTSTFRITATCMLQHSAVPTLGTQPFSSTNSVTSCSLMHG